MTVQESPGSSLESDTDRPSAIRAWTTVLLIMTLLVISFLDKSVPGLAAGQLRHDLGISASQFGLIGSADYVLAAVTCLLVGVLADRHSARRTLPISALLWSVAQLPALVVPGAGSLLAGRLLLGAGSGPVVPLAHATVYSWFTNRRRGLPAGVLTCGASIAKLALAPALGLVIAAWGWRVAFALTALLGLVWAAIWAWVGREGPYALPRDRAAAIRLRTHIAMAARTVRLRTVAGAAVALAAQAVLASFVLTWLPSYFAQALGFTQVQASSLFGVPCAFGIVALLGTGALSDRLLRGGTRGRLARGLLGGIVMGVSGAVLLALPFVADRMLAIAMVVVGYGLSVTVNVFANPVVAEVAGPARRASALAAITAITSIGSLCGPVLTGVVLDAAPNPVAGFAIAFRVFGLLLILGGLVFALLVNPERDRDATSA